METKQKTLAECKDEVALKYGGLNYKEAERYLIQQGSEERIFLLLDEAAELYANQTKQDYESYSAIEKAVEIAKRTVIKPKVVRDGLVKPKQSEPVSNVLIMDEIRRLIDWPNVKDNPNKITVETAFKLVNRFQSQQPASVAFLNEDEIDRICELRFSADEDDKMFKLGIEVAQTELRKRLNAVDPLELMNWINKENYEKIHGDRWCKQFMSQTHSSEELLQIYLTSKTK